ncbi:MAG: transporter substrate-binding domain-containing protein [Burkholderiales bacterium]|nr:transporter substrate-binding domain-containing protein [Burkholderiales bacterium]
MPFRWKKSLIAALGVVVMAGAARAERMCERVVVTGDPSYPPLHWYDGHTMHGAGIELVKHILTDLNIPYEVRFVGPFARVLASAKAGHIDIVTTLKRTPEREAFLSYTVQPAFINPVAVFVDSTHPIAYAQWSDLIGKRGGTIHGNKFGEPFDTYLSSHLSTEEADSMEINFRKLSAGRIDYVITGYYAGTSYLQSKGPGGAIVALRPYVNESNNYVAFVTQSPCIKYLADFNRRLIELLKTSEPDQLIQHAQATWRAAPVIGE